MNKKYSIVLALISMLFLSACAGVDLSNIDLSNVSEDDVNKIIVCNDPYIRHGTSCCLDQNKNNICDNDEKLDTLTINNDLNINPDKTDELEKYIDELETEISEVENELDNIEEELDEIEWEEFESEDYFENIEEYEFDLEVEVENNKVEIEWEEFDFDEFKYYKVLHSTTTPNIKYPETSAIHVGMHQEETYFEHWKPHQGTNYYRIGIVLENGEVLHSDTYELDFTNQEENIEIEVTIYENSSKIEVEINEKEHELEVELIDIVEIKEFIAKEFDLDYNFVVSNIEINYEKSQKDNEEKESESEEDSDEKENNLDNEVEQTNSTNQ